MTNGYYTSEVRIKKDAMPIDNITKFAWNDDDYETVEVFVEYTEEEMAEIADAKQLQQILSSQIWTTLYVHCMRKILL